MQTMEEQGKSSDNTPKFWKMVLEQLDGTWTHNQSGKMDSEECGRICWCDTDSRSLVKKYVFTQLSELF
jgi:hypothetical protein